MLIKIGIEICLTFEGVEFNLIHVVSIATVKYFLLGGNTI